MPELKPCPFCGSDDVELHGDAWVTCEDCGAETIYCETPEEAIGHWNKRV